MRRFPHRQAAVTPYATARRQSGFSWKGGATAAYVALTVGCSDDPAPLEPSLPELVVEARIEANQYNVLALNAVFSATGAQSARVHYRTSGGADETTPYSAVDDGEASLAVLGLLPEADYELEIEVVTPTSSVRTETMTWRTGAIPDEVRAITLVSTEGARPDRLLLAGLADYAVVFDGSGRVVWYREIDSRSLLVDATGTGTFVAFVGETRGWDPTFGYYVEISPSGEIVRQHAANAPLYTDNHEILLTVDETGGVSTHFFSYDRRTTDMSAYGGGASALVAGHQLLRFGPEGGLDFMWNAWDHLEVDEWEVAVPSPANCVVDCDFDHPNSIDFDLDGNYVVSLRSLNQVLFIEPRTGAVLWRLGGKNSDFTFEDDPLDGFTGQHTARITSEGHVLLFDNGPNHLPPHSRAVEYELNRVDSTASLVWSYVPDPALYSVFTSSVQRLGDGNTLISFSTGSHVHEVRPDGSVVWKGNLMVNGSPRSSYRIIEISSLYDPKRGGAVVPTAAAAR